MFVFPTTPSRLDESADASDEHAVQRLFLGCEHRFVEYLGLLAAHARERAEPIVTPWLDRNHGQLPRLRRAPEVIEEATQRFALRAASPDRVRAVFGDHIVGHEPPKLGAQLPVEALVVMEGLVAHAASSARHSPRRNRTKPLAGFQGAYKKASSIRVQRGPTKAGFDFFHASSGCSLRQRRAYSPSG